MLSETWEEALDRESWENMPKLGLEIAQAAWLDSTYQLIQPIRMLKMTNSLLDEEIIDNDDEDPIVRRHVLNLLLGHFRFSLIG